MPAKIVIRRRHASRTLTPVTLELGGKSPCIVDPSANLALAARRIVFGKFLNCGQTCVAPDYILCHESVAKTLVDNLKKEIKRQFGETPLTNQNYGKIINEKHFSRLLSLIEGHTPVIGGGYDASSLQIEPTVLTSVSWDDAVMREEIFGPVLPVLTYSSLDELIALLQPKPEPLALYLFSQDKRAIRKVTSLPKKHGWTCQCGTSHTTSFLTSLSVSF